MTIREANPEDAAAIAWVHVETWRTTYPGIMPQEHLDALDMAEHEARWRERLRGGGSDAMFVSVAETDAGEVVGFVSGGPERAGEADDTGEIYALYLLASHQGRGDGRRLVRAMARHLRAEGYGTLLIWVNAHNPARHFYEALGGRPARTGQRTIKGVVYDDLGYVWDEAALGRLLGE